MTEKEPKETTINTGACNPIFLRGVNSKLLTFSEWQCTLLYTENGTLKKLVYFGGRKIQTN